MNVIKRVVSIGAHSLDAEILGGAIMLKYAKQGAHCTYIHVTQGRLEDPDATQKAKDEYLTELLNQNRRAAEKLGQLCTIDVPTSILLAGFQVT